MKLVAYFSRNGENYTRNGIENLSVGNTEVVAKKIAEFIGVNQSRARVLANKLVNARKMKAKGKNRGRRYELMWLNESSTYTPFCAMIRNVRL